VDALRLDARRSPLGGGCTAPDMLGMLICALRFEREGRSERERRVEGFLGGRRGRGEIGEVGEPSSGTSERDMLVERGKYCGICFVKQ
jgi:hypothetical protein